MPLWWPQEPVPHGWILNPDSNTRISWDLGSLIMVLYDMVMIPMQAYDAWQKTKRNAGNVYETEKDSEVAVDRYSGSSAVRLPRIKPFHLEQQKQRTVYVGWNRTRTSLWILKIIRLVYAIRWESRHPVFETTTKWFKVIFWSRSWRLLNLWTGHLTFKKSHQQNLPRKIFVLAPDVSMSWPLRPVHKFGWLFGLYASW